MLSIFAFPGFDWSGWRWDNGVSAICWWKVLFLKHKYYLLFLFGFWVTNIWFAFYSYNILTQMFSLELWIEIVFCTQSHLTSFYFRADLSFSFSEQVTRALPIHWMNGHNFKLQHPFLCTHGDKEKNKLLCTTPS